MKLTETILKPVERCSGATKSDDLVKEGKAKPYQLDYERIHFTEVYEGIANISPARPQELYREINEYFYKETAVQSAG